MNALVLSDVKISFIHSPQVLTRFRDIDLVIGCGDLAYHYLEYVVSSLNAPLFYVRGNHDQKIEFGKNEQRHSPGGGVDLHRKMAEHKDLLLAGVEGSALDAVAACFGQRPRRVPLRAPLTEGDVERTLAHLLDACAERETEAMTWLAGLDAAELLRASRGIPRELRSELLRRWLGLVDGAAAARQTGFERFLQARIAAFAEFLFR